MTQNISATLAIRNALWCFVLSLLSWAVGLVLLALAFAGGYLALTGYAFWKHRWKGMWCLIGVPVVFHILALYFTFAFTALVLALGSF